MDLDAFFSQWVTDGTGYPTYAMSSNWKASGGGYTVWVSLGQTQQLPLSNVSIFEMPIDIWVQTLSGTQKFSVNNDQRIQMFEFFVSSEPLSVSIDPNRRILRSNAIATAVGATPIPDVTTIVSLTPNPAGHSLEVRLTLPAGEATIDVYDVAGRRVSSLTKTIAQSGDRIETLDTSSIAAGVYFLRVETLQGRATRKFAVVH
jgi:hypothetical protein